MASLNWVRTGLLKHFYWGFIFVTACSNQTEQELNLVCKGMSKEDGGPMMPLEHELGVSIRGNNIVFSGDVTMNLPASQRIATLCPKSKFSNAKVVMFDNEGCVNQDVAIGDRKQPDTQILGSYDYTTKVIAILSAGNFRCEAAK